MVCPYCFSEVQQPLPVCRNPVCGLYDQSMPGAPRRLLARLPERLRIRGGARMAEREVYCESCGQACALVCPCCTEAIPSAWGRYPGRSILLLGTNGAGKSTLLAMAKDSLSRKKEWRMMPLDAENTAERFYETYTAPISLRSEEIGHTPCEVPRPFLWGVTRQFEHRPPATLALSVYDVPGEMVTSHASALPIAPLLSRADGVMLVVHPAFAQMPCAAPNDVPRQVPGDVWGKAEHILDELLSREELGVRSRVRVALVLTHLDKWFASVSGCTTANELTSSCLEDLVGSWQGEALLSKLSCFSEHRFFATGLCRTPEIRPLDGAEKPLEYLLTSMGLR